MLTKLIRSKIFRYLKNFKEAVSVALFFIAAIANPLSPDLVITVRGDKLIVPVMTSTASPQEYSSNDGPLPSLLTIELHNRSFQAISDIELTVNGISNVITAATTSSSHRLLRDTPGISKAERKSDQSFYFPNISTLPPRQSITIQIACQLSELFSFQPRIEVASSAKTSSIEITSVVTSSVYALLYQYHSILGAVIMAGLIGLGLWRMAIRTNL